eukprot:TRINITY_DN1973_c0_g1_i2.p1 TRINITY_DN1973_c0_g1~~TRINITY_DN1973_c0_g1_i2.p1  ORF type:complete len:1237 (-),score=337.64 TRINITY_DN1973_c0_g1_i2:64-3774(-)
MMMQYIHDFKIVFVVLILSINGAPTTTVPFASLGPQSVLLNSKINNLTTETRVTGGMIRVLPHPTDPNIMYAAAVGGGVWKTTNALDPEGPQWFATTDNMPSLSMGALTFDYSDPDFSTILAGTGRFSANFQVGGQPSGVYKSTDSGASWVQIGGAALRSRSITGIAANMNRIVVCSNALEFFPDYVPLKVPKFAPLEFFSLDYENYGIWITSDNGATFNRHPSIGTNACTDVISNPNNPSEFFLATLTNGIFWSQDSGVTWNNIYNPFTRSENVRLSLYSDTLTGEKVLFAAFVKSSTYKLGEIVKLSFVEGTSSWEKIQLPVPAINVLSQGYIHLSIAAKSANHVYVAGDAGSTSFMYYGNVWEVKATEADLFVAAPIVAIPGVVSDIITVPHADSRDMKLDAQGNLIDADDGGLFKFYVDARSWSSLVGNLQTMEVHFTEISKYISTASSPIIGDISNIVSVLSTQDNGVIISFGELNNYQTLMPGQSSYVRTTIVIDNQSSSVRRNLHVYGANEYFQSFNHWIINLDAFASDPSLSIKDRSLVQLTSPGLVIQESGVSIYALHGPDWFNYVQNFYLNRYNYQRLLFAFTTDQTGFFPGFYESFDGGQTVTTVVLPAIADPSTFGEGVFGGKINGIEYETPFVVASIDTMIIRNTSGFVYTASPFPTTPPTTSSDSNYIKYPFIRDFDVNSNNFNQIAVLFNFGEVALSSNQGVSWKVIASVKSLQSSPSNAANMLSYTSANSISIVPTLDDIVALFVGTREGLYISFYDFNSNTQIVTWSKVSSLIPSNAYVSHTDYNPKLDSLVVSTYGRGSFVFNQASALLKVTVANFPTSPIPTPVPSLVPTSPVSTPVTIVEIPPTEPPTESTESPTEPPTESPTEPPTESPTELPTESPTESPTEPPTESPTEAPTESPTEPPTEPPTESPTESPTEAPTEAPTEPPTETPTESPTEAPTESSTESPTEIPTDSPTLPPSETPVDSPTESPTEQIEPTESPTETPTQEPTEPPTESNEPTESPTDSPTDSPTETPIELETEAPTEPPTLPPTHPHVNPPTDPPVDPPTLPPAETPTDPPTNSPVNPPTDPPVEETETPTETPTESPTQPPIQPPTLAPISPTQAPTQSPTQPPTQPPTRPPIDPDVFKVVSSDVMSKLSLAPTNQIYQILSSKIGVSISDLRKMRQNRVNLKKLIRYYYQEFEPLHLIGLSSDSIIKLKYFMESYDPGVVIHYSSFN